MPVMPYVKHGLALYLMYDKGYNYISKHINILILMVLLQFDCDLEEDKRFRYYSGLVGSH